jgi:hypothetical protein
MPTSEQIKAKLIVLRIRPPFCERKSSLPPTRASYVGQAGRAPRAVATLFRAMTRRAGIGTRRPLPLHLGRVNYDRASPQ